MFDSETQTCKVSHIASSLGAQTAAQHMDPVIGAQLLPNQPHDQLCRLVPHDPGVLHSRVVPENILQVDQIQKYSIHTMETLQVIASQL